MLIRLPIEYVHKTVYLDDVNNFIALEKQLDVLKSEPPAMVSDEPR